MACAGSVHAGPASIGQAQGRTLHLWIACRALRAGQAPDAVADLIACEALADGKRPDEAEAMEYARATVDAAMRAVRR